MDNSVKNSSDDYALWQTFVHSNQAEVQAILATIAFEEKPNCLFIAKLGLELLLLWLCS